jgi:cation diffusion facilitator family transporter
VRKIERTEVKAGVRAIYYQAMSIALFGNGLLLAIKAFAARLSGSSALYADTANSASDVAYSLLMMAGLWLSLRPPDKSHPHGHERIESLVSVAIGLFMGYAGYEALDNGLSAWKGERQLDLTNWILLVPVFTVLVKGGMYTRVKRLAQRVNSPAILATAYDNLSDILTSGVVLVGIVGAKLAFALADPIAGVIVAIWVFYQAAKVVLDGIGQLIGRAGSIEAEKAIIDAIVAVPGVVGLDKVVMEHVGPRLRVDVHVYADGSMPLESAHKLSHAVREAVEALDYVDHAFVHVEPASNV